MFATGARRHEHELRGFTNDDTMPGVLRDDEAITRSKIDRFLAVVGIQHC